MKSMYCFWCIISVSMLIFSTRILADTGFKSEHDFLKALSQLEDQTTLSPNEKLSQLRINISHIQGQNWPLAKLSASVFELELQLKLEVVTFNAEQIDNLMTQAKNLSSEKNLVQLKLLELGHLSYSNNTTEVVNKQLSLLEKVKNVKDSDFAARIFSAVGRSQLVLSNWQGAISSLKNAYDLYKKMNDMEGVAGVLNMLGSINISMKNFDTAIQYFEEALEIAKQQGDEFRMSVIFYNIGEAYSEDKKLDLSIEYHNEALKLSIKLKDEVGVAYSNFALGDVFVEKQQCSKALKLYEASYKHFNSTENLRRQVSILAGKSKCYIAIKDDVKAIGTLAKMEALLTTLDDPNSRANYLTLLADAMSLRGKYESAYYALKEKLVLLDELHAKEKEQEIYKFKVQFDSQLVEEKNEALTIQNELTELKLKQQIEKEKVWGVILILSILTLLAIMWVLLMRIKLSNRFKKMAFLDQLTSCPNRRNILKHSEKMFENAKQFKTPFIIAMVDLDRFKNINDTYGHDVGDNVLKCFALLCKANLRGTDKYGRFGGEEWLFAFEHNNAEVIQHIFERLRTTLKQASIEGLPKDYDVTFSMGVSFYDPATEDNLKSLIKIADQNLYLAKQQGRNKLVF